MPTPSIKIAANQAVIAYGAEISRLKDFAINFAADIADKGASVEIPILDCDAGEFNATSNNYAQNTEVSAETLPLDKQYVAGFGVTDKQWNDGVGAYDGLMMQSGEVAGTACAKSVEELVFKPVTATAITKESAFTPTTLDDVTNLVALCDTNDINVAQSVLVLNPVTYTKVLSLLGKDVVDFGKAIESGRVENLLGFKSVIRSRKVDTSLVGFIAERGAIGIGSRALDVGNDYDYVENLTDPATGAVITILAFRDRATGIRHVSATCLVGAKIVHEKGILALTPGA